MTGRSIGLMLTACSVTLAGHGAMRSYGQSVQAKLTRDNEVMISRVMRAELVPLHADIDRAHTRIDELWRVAMKEQR